MGDLLRRLLYPLLLPAIVATVWMHAWAVKQDPDHVGHGPSLPPTVSVTDPSFGFPAPSSGYGFSDPDDAFAGLDFDEDAAR